MKKEWVKLKTAVNMAAAMEVLTQSFTFKFTHHLNQQVSYLNFSCIFIHKNSNQVIAVWKSFFSNISALRSNFDTIRRGPPFWKLGVFGQLSDPRPNGKFFDHEKCFLTYLREAVIYVLAEFVR